MSKRSMFLLAPLAIALLAAVGATSAGAIAPSSNARATAQTVTLPKKTIGWIDFLKGIESNDRIRTAFVTAAQTLGWHTIVCDGKGDPTQMTRCADSLLARRVDAIASPGIDPQLIAAPLRKAKSRGVPVISAGGLVSKGYDGAYYPNEALAGQILADYLIKQLNGKVTGEKTIAINDFPASWCTGRTAELNKKLQNTDIKIVANQTTDATNIIDGTRKQTTDALTAHPNLSAFWFCFDTAGQAGGQAVLAKYQGKTFPDKPLVVTFHADKGTQALIAQGAIDAVVDVNYDASAWIAVDQLAAFFATKKPFAKSPQPKYPVRYFEYTVVTKANLPKVGTYLQPKDNYIAFLKNKWKKAYGK